MHSCTGFQYEGNAAYDKWTVHSVIPYLAGFKFSKDKDATAVLLDGKSDMKTDMMYTILDGAIALTVSAAALASVSMNMF